MPSFVELWRAGVSVREICSVLGASENRVNYLRKKHRVPNRRCSNIDPLKFILMYRAGSSMADIKAAFGLRSVTTVRKYRKQLGLTPRHPAWHNTTDRKIRLAIAERLKTGVSQKAAAEEFGVARHVARRVHQSLKAGGFG